MQERLANLSELIKSEFSKEVITECKKEVSELEEIFANQKQDALKTFLEDPENKAEDFDPTPGEDERLFDELNQQFREKRKAFAEQRALQEKENLKKKLAIIDNIATITREEENIGKAFSMFNELQEEFKGIGRVPGDKHRDIQNNYLTAVDSFYYHISIYRDLKDFDLKKNLESKQEIVGKLEVLAKASGEKLEENVKILQQEWYDIGPVPKDDYEALKEKFNAALDAVYEIIKTKRNERKEMLLENLGKKKELLAAAEQVVAEKPTNAKAWNKATEKIIEIQKIWKTIGFGPRKENEEIWLEFRGLCDQFFADKSKFFEDYKKELSLNQTQKEELCDKAEVYKDSTDWKETTRQIIDLQKKWKSIGPAPMAHEQKLWKRFRAACDGFFTAKENNFKQAEEKYEGNLKAKEAFIKKVSETELPANKAEAGKVLKSILVEWSGLGKVPKNHIDSINEAFQTAFDAKMEAAGIEKEELEHSKFTSRVNGLLADKNYKSLLAKEKSFIAGKIDEFNKQAVQFENNLAFFNSGKNSNSPLLVEAKKKIESTRHAIDKMKQQIDYINRSIRQKEREENAESSETANVDESK